MIPDIYSISGRRVLILLFNRGDKLQKSLATPAVELAPYSWMRGMVDDYARRRESGVHLPEEAHHGKKPVSLTLARRSVMLTRHVFVIFYGALRFTEASVRDGFTNIVLNSVVHPPAFDVIADELAERMFQLNNGRIWMAAHMRRGDCEFRILLPLTCSIDDLYGTSCALRNRN